MQLILKTLWNLFPVLDRKNVATEFINIKQQWNNLDNGSSPFSNLSVQGAMNFAVRTSTSSTSLGRTDYLLIVNSASPTTVTLPAATAGAVYVVMSAGAGRVTINPNGAQTINGGTSITIPAQYFHFQFFSDGSNWFAI